MTKVVIEVAGHSVTIEADDTDLDTVATKALELWQATRDPQITRAFGSAGFATDRSGADGNYTSGYDHS